ncbi:AI-2E family transporter [Salegentibacter sp. LM13S]|uniref:AI-2E family transporter n=1 Tax=Salegentibacter lacus TaxID=2873599 RepID=UPI001CD02344|nr:AI-2E family transporter [Salegentibacter lacus]MBZ9632239.1 AI-2E family transporter [Salegentibacter lacus]
MNTAHKTLLYPLVALIVGAYFLFTGLADARGFLAPLVTAIILALLLIPLGNLMENKLNRLVSSLLSTVLLLLFSFGVFILLSFQIKNFVDDWNKIKETMTPKIEQLQNYAYEHTALSSEDLEKYKEKNDIQSILTSSGNSGQKAFNFINSVTSFLSNYLLTFIYIFFLLNYRKRFKVFILKLFSKERKQEVKRTINQTARVAQFYLRGKLILIIILSILYSIGLGISGVNNFILIAVIASFLTLIPFIGNIIGMGLALIFGYLTQGETSILIGVILTFTIVQFIESYVLEPFIVGDKVDIHPFFVILAIILGNMVWGVMGMILAIPVLGILNVIFNHTPALKPFGYLLSTDEDED